MAYTHPKIFLKVEERTWEKNFIEVLKIIHSLCLLSCLSISRCRITIVPHRKYAPYDRCPSLNHRRRKYPRPRRYNFTLFIFVKNIVNSFSYVIPFSKIFFCPSFSKRHNKEKKIITNLLSFPFFLFFSKKTRHRFNRVSLPKHVKKNSNFLTRDTHSLESKRSRH